jgi:hypothetical protein
MTLPPAGAGEHDRLVYHLGFSGDAKKVSALFGAQGFSYSTNQPLDPPKDWHAIWDLSSGGLSARQSLDARIGRSSGIARDQKTLVTGGSIVNLLVPKATSRLEGVATNDSSIGYVFSRDGSLVAGDFTEEKNKVSYAAGVAIWETATGKLIARLKTKSWSGELLFHPSSRFLAVNDLDGIHLWDIATGKKIATRKLPERVRASTTPGTYSSCFAFTPDGKRMVTGHTDGTILVWEVELPQAKAVRLDPDEMEALWADLKDTDASKAWRAVWRLAGSPDDVVPFLRKHLKAFPPAPAEVTGPLLVDLGSDSFARREAATKRLKELGLLAEPALLETLSANPTLELRQRIEPLLKAIAETPRPLTADSLRDLRAVAVLGRLNSPPARELLQALTKGVPSAPLTSAAEAALRP